MVELTTESPLAERTEVIINASGDWTIGNFSAKHNMTNILKNPLLKKLAISDHDINTIVKKSLSDSHFLDYRQSKATVLDHKYALPPTLTRLVSVSSTNSSSSDQSSTSTCCSSFQGMLQCTWKDGLPHHVFTVDDKREIYVANSSKVVSSNAKTLDYVYSFHSRRNAKNERDIHDLDAEIVGQMQVANSIRFCSDNSLEIRETRFILSACDDNRKQETQTSVPTVPKNKRLNWRPGHRSFKQRPSSKFEASSAISEDTLWEPAADTCNRLESIAPNLELAAIIVKEACVNRKVADLGGWGLKFLKRPGNGEYLETLTPPKCTFLSAGDCLTSMDVLIPAGFHGGPRIGVGGPSSLVERWSSGGRCDCGGWDIGCPLTILNTKSNDTNPSSEANNTRECKSVDLVIQGSKQDLPTMKIMNIHDGLYYIHFQSSLSTLQCFAIAVAIIHSRNPALRYTKV